MKNNRYFLLGSLLFAGGALLIGYWIQFEAELWLSVIQIVGMGVGAILVAIGTLYLVYQSKYVFSPFRAWLVPIVVTGTLIGSVVSNAEPTAGLHAIDGLRFLHFWVIVTALGAPLGASLKAADNRQVAVVVLLVVLTLYAMITGREIALGKVFNPLWVIPFGMIGGVVTFLAYALTEGPYSRSGDP